MRDCVFLVADSHMQAAFTSFLSLEHKAQKLGCGPFRFNAESDLVLAGNDPAVHRRGHELLRPYLRTHRYAVLALDFAFGHQLQPSEITSELTKNMQGVGWDLSRFVVILIVPELEQWFWQDDPSVQEEVLLRDLSPAERAAQGSLRAFLASQSDGHHSLWPPDQPKPRDPKEAMQRAMVAFRRRSSPPAIFGEVFRRVSVTRCQDPAFCTLRTALATWFPAAPTEECA
jgi:hypothetical protein